MTNVAEIFKFIDMNMRIDYRGFYWWLKENGFQQMRHEWNQFAGGVLHHEVFENNEYRIDIEYVEKKGGMISLLKLSSSPM